ncbi:energy transducer TonB [Hymenobacter sp. CRA2]|uniref:energy transducer TonB n=1 Tax=Hymenobacter sp. CRA2 TaxID=1955620 RepID=UPI0009902A3C|nr:energy transducer TonB [Hymenobacter sp. CRA2]OON69488.1 hypothetical protein B0919_09440 [Hymenobacter sp. CRA2]
MHLPIRLLGTLLLGALAVGATAQQLPASELRTETEYYDAKRQKLSSAEGAAVRVETQFADSLQAIETTYNAAGARVVRTPFEHHRKRIQHGVAERWYDNGQLHWRDTWVHGKREGELLVYYPTGQLKRREKFVGNKSKGGTCYAADGREVPYFAFERMPEMPGGMNALMQHLGKNMRYPAAALRERVQGKVFVSFVVDSLGRVTNPVVRQGLHPALDAEALRVVASLPQWQPGWQDDIAVEVVFTVPISFTIAGPAPRRSKRTSEADF